MAQNLQDAGDGGIITAIVFTPIQNPWEKNTTPAVVTPHRLLKRHVFAVLMDGMKR